MVKLLAAVGAGGTNAAVDVKAVQNLLNQSIRTITPLAPLRVTGVCDDLTIQRHDFLYVRPTQTA